MMSLCSHARVLAHTNIRQDLWAQDMKLTLALSHTRAHARTHTHTHVRTHAHTSVRRQVKAHYVRCGLHQLYAASRAKARQARGYLIEHLPCMGFSAADVDLLLRLVLDPALDDIVAR